MLAALVVDCVSHNPGLSPTGLTAYQATSSPGLPVSQVGRRGIIPGINQWLMVDDRGLLHGMAWLSCVVTGAAAVAGVYW